MQVQTLPGFRDFYPDIAALRNKIFRTWRSVALRYGFEEYDGPPLEALDLYTRKSGEEIVEQLYHFTDKGGREVALRPEMTPTLARMVAARAQGLKKPIRWFSMPQLFRYERQQRGRLREHFQFNVDIIGETSPLADAEVIAVAVDVTRDLGFTSEQVRVRISDRRIIARLLGAAGIPEDKLGAAYAAIDKIEREDPARLLQGLTDAGVDASVAERVLAVGRLSGPDAVRDALAAAGAVEVGNDLDRCLDALGSMGLGSFMDVDLSIVRGLAYYTGIVFELFDAGKSHRAICGGGRYDDLLHSLGGVDLPAVGFGMGDVVLGDLVKAHEGAQASVARLDAFMVAVTGAEVPEVIRLAHELRDRGVRVEFALKPQSVVKQLKIAAARPARYAVIMGPDERKAKRVVVRDLDAGEERQVTVAALLDDYAWK